MSKKRLPINVYRYYDYRTFLSDLFRHIQNIDRSFSYREFSRKARFSAPNMLKQVIEGKRNLNPKTIGQITEAFDFNKGEGEFFSNLVFMNQASTHREKDLFYRRLCRSRQYIFVQEGAQELYRFYSHWYYPVIREMVLLDDFCDDPNWIAHRISPSIKPAEARKALEELVSMGHITQKADGSWTQQSPLATTGAQIESIAVVNYHKAMIAMAGDVLDTISHESRNVSSLTLAASEETYKSIVAELQATRRRIIELAVADRKATNVFQVNLQLFPVTNDEKKVENI